MRYQQLIAGLKDMVDSGRLKEEAIPDDYLWLKQAIAEGQEACGVSHAPLRQQAKEQYASGSDNNIEVDDDAETSTAEDGCWVSAWVWIGNAL